MSSDAMYGWSRFGMRVMCDVSEAEGERRGLSMMLPIDGAIVRVNPAVSISIGREECPMSWNCLRNSM